MAAAARGAEGDPSASLDTAAIISGGLDGTEPQNPPLEVPPEAGTDPDPPLKKKRPPSWRVLMTQLSLEDFIHLMRIRAERSSDFAFRRLQQVGITAWSVRQVLEMGECPMTF